MPPSHRCRAPIPVGVAILVLTAGIAADMVASWIVDEGKQMDDELADDDTAANAVVQRSSIASSASATGKSYHTSVMKKPSHTTTESNAYDSMTSIISRLTKKQFYDKHEAPSKDKPTEVKLGIYVNSFYSISEQTMDYSVSMYLRQAWNDPRLAFRTLNSRLKKIRLGDTSWNDIWIPDTFFRNEKDAQFHEVTVKNRLLRLSDNGDLWYVTKISAVLSCPMTLQKYPLDTQSCPMMFESFGYTMDTMYFSWLDNTVEIDKDLQLPQFFLQDHHLYDCSQNYTAGSFPCLEIRFILQRDFGYFLIQVYVPSVLIVILSWVSFWINVEGSPARVSLGLLTVLTTTTMSAGARASLPRVSYIKAIDVWMIVCLIFVFASLIEYAVVNVLSRKAPRPISSPASVVYEQHHPSSATRRAVVVRGVTAFYRRAPITDPSPPVTSTKRSRPQSPVLACSRRGQPIIKPNGDASASEYRVTMPSTSGNPGLMTQSTPSAFIDGKLQARRIDKLSRKCFPLAFVLFNVIYWLIYARTTSTSDYEEPS